MESIEIKNLSVNDLKQIIREVLEEWELENGKNDQNDESSDYLTRMKVADKLHISLPTLHKLVNQGYLSPYRVGNRVLFKNEDIEEFLESYGK